MAVCHSGTEYHAQVFFLHGVGEVILIASLQTKRVVAAAIQLEL